MPRLNLLMTSNQGSRVRVFDLQLAGTRLVQKVALKLGPIKNGEESDLKYRFATKLKTGCSKRGYCLRVFYSCIKLYQRVLRQSVSATSYEIVPFVIQGALV